MMQVKIDNVDNAYKEVLDNINALRIGGINVCLKTPKILREADDPREIETVKKYNTPDRLNWSKWWHIEFYPKTVEQSQRISQARDDLNKLGIRFDTGAGSGVMDWEIDWSFRLSMDNEEIKLNPVINKWYEKTVFDNWTEDELEEIEVTT